MRRKFSRLETGSLLLGLLLSARLASAAVSVDFISPDHWAQPDAAIGLAGGAVEDFEDHSLAPGLFIEISDAQGNFTGTGWAALPNLFDPVAGDPFGDSFATGVWDGNHVLVNTPANESIDYGSPDWRPVAVYVPEGALWIAIASQQVTVNHTLVVNGQARGRLGALGFNLSNGRNGVMIVGTDDPSDPIVSVSFGGGGDAFVIDHVVFQPVSQVPVDRVAWDAVKALYR